MPPSTGVDKWLKGLEDLTTLDPAELEERIAGLEQEAEVIKLKIFVLKPLLEAAKQRHEAKPSNGSLASGGPVGGQSPILNDDRPSTWKRDAVLEHAAEHPHQMFTPREMRNALRAKGVLRDDEGTVMSVLLKRLADRGQLHIEDGRYGHKPPAQANFSDNPFTRQAEPDD
jgi:hypothetical protein